MRTLRNLRYTEGVLYNRRRRILNERVCIGEQELLSEKNRFRSKQSRESTKGYSKSIGRKNNDKFGKRIGLNN